MEVRWNPSSSISNVTSYVILYTTTASYTDGGNMSVNGSDTTNGTLTDLEEYTLYDITVRAISGRGVISNDSNVATVRTFTDSK